MIELSKSDSSSIKNPSKYDLQKALAELMDHKHDFIILNVDSANFIQVICNNGLYNIEYRIGETDLVKVKKTFKLIEATDLLESFRVRDFKSVLQRTNLELNKSQVDNHLKWRDKKNTGKLTIINSLFLVAKGIVPFQIAICLVLFMDFFIFETEKTVYSVVSIKTEYGGSRFSRGIKLIAPNYANTYYLIYGRSGSKTIRVSVSNDFGEYISPGNHINISSTKLLGLTNGVLYTVDSGLELKDYRSRILILTLILSITLLGYQIKKHGRKINYKEYEESKRSARFYEVSFMVRYMPIIYLFANMFLLILIL